MTAEHHREHVPTQIIGHLALAHARPAKVTVQRSDRTVIERQKLLANQLAIVTVRCNSWLQTNTTTHNQIILGDGSRIPASEWLNRRSRTVAMQRARHSGLAPHRERFPSLTTMSSLWSRIQFACTGCWRSPAIGELQRTPLPDGLQPEMRELRLGALRGTHRDLQAELAQYDGLHDVTLIEATGIVQLPRSLIRARIARGLARRQLVERIGVQEQVIQRYEAADYFGVSFHRLVEIANGLEISVDYVIHLDQS